VALSRTKATEKVSKLRYAAHAVDPAVQTSLDMIVMLEEELFHANEAGDWEKLAAVGTAEPDEETEATSTSCTSSESKAMHADLAEGYSGATPIAQSERPGSPPSPSSRRFSWLLRRLSAKEDHADSASGAFGSVPGTDGL